MTMTVRLALLVLALSVNLSFSTISETDIYIKEGSVMVVYFGRVSSDSYHNAQNAMVFQMTAEKYQPELQGNRTVGYILVGTHSMEMSEWVPTLQSLIMRYPNIVGVIGITRATDLVQVASLLSALRIPSFVLGSNTISDHLLEQYNYEVILPLKPTSTEQLTKVLPSLIKMMNANSVSLIYDNASEEDFTNQMPVLVKNIRTLGIDMERIFTIGADGLSDQLKTRMRNRLERCINDNRSMVVVALVSKDMVSSLLEYFTEEIAGSLDLKEASVLVITTSTSCTIELAPKFAAAGVHLIRLCQTYKAIPELENFIRSNPMVTDSGDPLNPLLSSVINAQNCSGNRSCLLEFLLPDVGRSFSSYNHRLYYSLRPFMTALTDVNTSLIEAHANRTKNTITPMDKTLSTSIMANFKEQSEEYEEGFQFSDENPVPSVEMNVLYDDNPMEVWSETNATANKSLSDSLIREVSTYQPLRMKCSEDCTPGEYKSLARSEGLVNCWDCVRCEGNKFSNVTNADYCEECQEGRWVNEARTDCSLTATSLDLIETTFGNVVTVLVVLSVIIVTATLVCYLYFWNSKVVRASGRDLAILMFPGMFCGLLNAALVSSPPSQLVCDGILLTAHIFLILVLIPIAVRTFRILVIFKFAATKKELTEYVKGWFVYLYAVLLSIPAVVCLLCSFFLPQYRYRKEISFESYLQQGMSVTESCKADDSTLIYVLMAYAMVLLVVSSCLGFLTRKLPDNFKESMHIFICSLLTLALVSTFVPAMVLLPGKKQVFSLSVIVTILVLAVNCLIFIPKVTMLYRNPALRRAVSRKRGSSRRAYSTVTTLPNE